MRMTLTVQGLEQLKDRLVGFSDRRMRAAVATALTRTAAAVKRAEELEILDVFDRPTPYTQRAIGMEMATAADLQARVFVKTDASGGRPPISWLRWHITGGARRLTGFEKALVRAGAMDDDNRAIPARYAKLDAFGNMSRGQMAQIFSQLRIETGRAGSIRTLPRLSFEDRKVDRQAKLRTIRASYRKAGGQYVAFPYGRGKLAPGLYLADRFNRQQLLPVLIYVRWAMYEAERFDFEGAARITAQRVFPTQIRRAFAEQAARLAAR